MQNSKRKRRSIQSNVVQFPVNEQLRIDRSVLQFLPPEAQMRAEKIAGGFAIYTESGTLQAYLILAREWNEVR